MCSAVPRHPGHNNVWEFDIELGNIAEDARDDPGKHRLHCVIKEVNIHIFKKSRHNISLFKGGDYRVISNFPQLVTLVAFLFPFFDRRGRGAPLQLQSQTL